PLHGSSSLTARSLLHWELSPRTCQACEFQSRKPGVIAASRGRSAAPIDFVTASMTGEQLEFRILNLECVSEFRIRNSEFRISEASGDRGRFPRWIEKRCLHHCRRHMVPDRFDRHLAFE